MLVCFCRWVQAWHGWGQYVDRDHPLSAVCQQWTRWGNRPAEGVHVPLPKCPQLQWSLGKHTCIQTHLAPGQHFNTQSVGVLEWTWVFHCSCHRFRLGVTSCCCQCFSTPAVPCPLPTSMLWLHSWWRSWRRWSAVGQGPLQSCRLCRKASGSWRIWSGWVKSRTVSIPLPNGPLKYRICSIKVFSSIKAGHLAQCLWTCAVRDQSKGALKAKFRIPALVYCQFYNWSQHYAAQHYIFCIIYSYLYILYCFILNSASSCLFVVKQTASTDKNVL